MDRQTIPFTRLNARNTYGTEAIGKNLTGTRYSSQSGLKERKSSAVLKELQNTANVRYTDSKGHNSNNILVSDFVLPRARPPKIPVSSEDKENLRVKRDKFIPIPSNDTPKERPRKGNHKRRNKPLFKENEVAPHKVRHKTDKVDAMPLVKTRDNSNSYRNEVEALLRNEEEDYKEQFGVEPKTYQYMYMPDYKKPSYYNFDDDEYYFEDVGEKKNASDAEMRLKQEEKQQKEEDEKVELMEAEKEGLTYTTTTSVTTVSEEAFEDKEGEKKKEETAEQHEEASDNFDLDETGFFDVSEECVKTNACPPVDGGWSEWSPWACPQVCDKGFQQRKRQCTEPPPKNGGETCPGDDIERNPRRPCDMKECRHASIPKGIKEMLDEEVEYDFLSLEANEGENVTVPCSSDWIMFILKMIPGSSLRWYHNDAPLYFDGTRMWMDENGMMNSKRIHYELTDGQLWRIACHSSMLARQFPLSKREWKINNTLPMDELLAKADAELNVVENLTIVGDHHMGEWLCSVTTQNESLRWYTNKFNVKVIPPPFPWWILLIAALLLVLLLLFAICCILWWISKRHLKTEKLPRKRGKKPVPQEREWDRYVCFEAQEGGYICIEDPDNTLGETLADVEGIYVVVEPRKRRIKGKCGVAGKRAQSGSEFSIETVSLSPATVRSDDVNVDMTNWLLSSYAEGKGFAVTTPFSKRRKFLKSILRRSSMGRCHDFAEESEPLLLDFSKENAACLESINKEAPGHFMGSTIGISTLNNNKKVDSVPAYEETRLILENSILTCSGDKNKDIKQVSGGLEENKKDTKSSKSSEKSKNESSNKKGNISPGKMKSKSIESIPNSESPGKLVKKSAVDNDKSKSEEFVDRHTVSKAASSKPEDKGGGKSNCRRKGGQDEAIDSELNRNRKFRMACNDLPKSKKIPYRLATMGVPLPGLAAMPREENPGEQRFECCFENGHRHQVFSPIPLMGLARDPMPAVLSKSDLVCAECGMHSSDDSIPTRRMCCGYGKECCGDRSDGAYMCRSSDCGCSCCSDDNEASNFAYQYRRNNSDLNDSCDYRSLPKHVFRPVQNVQTHNHYGYNQNNCISEHKGNASYMPEHSSDGSQTPNSMCCSPSVCSEACASRQSSVSNLRDSHCNEIAKNIFNQDQSHSSCFCSDREKIQFRSLQKFYVPRCSRTQVLDSPVSCNKKREPFRESGILAYYPDRGPAYTPYSISPGPTHDKVPDVDCLLAKCRNRNRQINSKSCIIDAPKTDAQESVCLEKSRREPENVEGDQDNGDETAQSPTTPVAKSPSPHRRRHATPCNHDSNSGQKPSRSQIAAMVEKALQARLSCSKGSESVLSALDTISKSPIIPPPPPPLPAFLAIKEATVAAPSALRSCAGCDCNFRNSPTESEISSSVYCLSDEEADESTLEHSRNDDDRNKSARSGRNSAPLKSFSSSLVRKSSSLIRPKSGSYRGSLSFDSLTKQYDNAADKTDSTLKPESPTVGGVVSENETEPTQTHGTTSKNASGDVTDEVKVEVVGSPSRGNSPSKGRPKVVSSPLQPIVLEEATDTDSELGRIFNLE